MLIDHEVNCVHRTWSTRIAIKLLKVFFQQTRFATAFAISRTLRKSPVRISGEFFSTKLRFALFLPMFLLANPITRGLAQDPSKMPTMDDLLVGSATSESGELLAAGNGLVVLARPVAESRVTNDDPTNLGVPKGMAKSFEVVEQKFTVLKVIRGSCTLDFELRFLRAKRGIQNFPEPKFRHLPFKFRIDDSLVGEASFDYLLSLKKSGRKTVVLNAQWHRQVTAADAVFPTW